MALSEYLHEMPRNRIICRKKVIKCAKKGVYPVLYNQKAITGLISGYRPLQ